MNDFTTNRYPQAPFSLYINVHVYSEKVKYLDPSSPEVSDEEMITWLFPLVWIFLHYAWKYYDLWTLILHNPRKIKTGPKLNKDIHYDDYILNFLEFKSFS